MRALLLFLFSGFKCVLTIHCGLPNIGNSCYINSALQVLYRTDIIRNTLLQPSAAEYVNLNLKTALMFLNDVDTGTVYRDAKEQAIALSQKIDSRKREIDSRNPVYRQKAYDSDTELQKLVRQATHFASIVSEINCARKRVLVIRLVAAIRDLFTAMHDMEASTCDSAGLVAAVGHVHKNIVPLLGDNLELHAAGETSEVLMKVLECFEDIAPLESMYTYLLSTYFAAGTSISAATLILNPVDTTDITVRDLILNSQDIYESVEYADILFVSINRRQHVGSKYVKLATPIIYPAVFSLGEHIYHLHSIVVHEGDGGGHYYTVSKDLDSDIGNWVVYNDSSTTTLSESHVLTEYRLLVTHMSYIRQHDFDTLTNRSWISSCMDIGALEDALKNGKTDNEINKRLDFLRGRHLSTRVDVSDNSSTKFSPADFLLLLIFISWF